MAITIIWTQSSFLTPKKVFLGLPGLPSGYDSVFLMQRWGSIPGGETEIPLWSSQKKKLF